MSDSLLARVSRFLDRERVLHALIGAAAMAVHGVSRSTLDQDLLTTDTRVLAPDFWAAFDGPRADVRRGDADDPLAGVVRVAGRPDRDVDVVVGRHGWQQQAVDRALRFPGFFVPVVTAADLVLLKLYAGGSQDRWDVEQLLASGDASAIRRDVADRLPLLPPAASELWSQWQRNG